LDIEWNLKLIEVRIETILLIFTEEDPLHWWNVNKYKYPILSSLALQYLGIPATSADSERTFSHTGEIVNKRRVRLSSELIDELSFINYNYVSK
jgi:hypothetical protein